MASKQLIFWILFSVFVRFSDCEKVKPTSSPPQIRGFSAFHDSINYRLISDKLHRITCGVVNIGKENFTLIHLKGEYRSVASLESVANFSERAYYQVVNPNELASFDYYIYAESAHENRQFVFLLTALLTNPEGKGFYSVLFNDTISILSPGTSLPLDLTFIFIYFTLTLAVFGSAFLGYRKVFPTKSVKIRSKSPSASSESDWVQVAFPKSKTKRS
eukprot:Sdes_comp10167_c0_seq1m1781